MAFRTGNRMSPREQKTMTELLETIASSTNEELQHEANMFKLRNTFARDVRQENVISSKPRSKKFQVDTTLTSRNAQLSTSVHPDNQNQPDLITGSLDQLFDGNRSPTKFRL